MPSARSPNASTTRSALTCPSPNPRSPGVSISHPSPSGRATAEEDVCLPRPVTGLTEPTERAASGTTVFTNVDLPTPDCPMSTLIRPVSTFRTRVSVWAGSGRRVVIMDSPSGA